MIILLFARFGDALMKVSNHRFVLSSSDIVECTYFEVVSLTIGLVLPMYFDAIDRVTMWDSEPHGHGLHVRHPLLCRRDLTKDDAMGLHPTFDDDGRCQDQIARIVDDLNHWPSMRTRTSSALWTGSSQV